LERQIIKEEKELTALNQRQKEKSERCETINAKLTYVQYALIFVLFYFIQRPLAQVGDGDNNRWLKAFLFPMHFKPVTIGGLLLPTGSIGALAIMLASRVVVKRLLKNVVKMFQ